MLFKEILGGQYKVFARMKDDERARNIGIVKYIENLSSMAGVDIQEWDAHNLFGADGNKLIDNKNEINRRFFEEVDRLIAAAPPVEAGSDVLTDEMKLAVRAAENRHIATLLAKEQQAADSTLRTAMDQYRAYEQYMKKAGEAFANVRRLSGQGSNLEEQVRQVNSTSFWQFSGFTDNAKLRFKTRADIVLTHKNPAAGVDMTINFGRFEAVFNIVDFSLHVHGIGRNIQVSGYPHPHIQARGSICWGSASTAATTALAKCNFVEPMTLLAAVLSSYNKDSPYVTMERFQEVIGRPEEIAARDAMIVRVAEQQALFAAADAAEHNLDRRRAPPPPVVETVIATPETNPVAEAAPDIAVEAAPARRARRPRATRTDTGIAVTVTTTDDDLAF